VNRSTRWLALVAGFSTVTAGILALPAEAAAQRRAASRPAVRPVVVRPVVVPVRPPLYYRYAPYYGLGMSFAWYDWSGWSPYGFYGYPYPYGYPYRPFYGPRASSVRIQVEPKHAEVYVDGHFVGTVDDFDGWAQRLTLPPGERVLEIYLEGYRTYRQNVLFRPGASIRIQHTLEPLPTGEPPEGRPAPGGTSAGPAARPPYHVPPRRPPGRPQHDAAPQGTYGALAVRVQPADAEVIVDGESWESPEAGDLTLQLAEGRHTVEVRREGFRPFRADVEVRRGETTTLNVSLSRQ